MDEKDQSNIMDELQRKEAHVTHLLDKLIKQLEGTPRERPSEGTEEMKTTNLIANLRIISLHNGVATVAIVIGDKIHSIVTFNIPPHQKF